MRGFGPLLIGVVATVAAVAACSSEDRSSSGADPDPGTAPVETTATPGSSTEPSRVPTGAWIVQGGGPGDRALSILYARSPGCGGFVDAAVTETDTEVAVTVFVDPRPAPGSDGCAAALTAGVASIDLAAPLGTRTVTGGCPPVDELGAASDPLDVLCSFLARGGAPGAP